jgi:prepilin-type N-terminal cleavage/methylation domain-containing protein
MTCEKQRDALTRFGFTLIELLVVIAIIAETLLWRSQVTDAGFVNAG